MNESDRHTIASELRILVRDYEDSDKKSNEAFNQLESRVDSLEDKVDNLPEFIERTHEEFEKYTTLTRSDMNFLTLAVTLQTIRQVLLNTYKQRLDDKTSAKSTPGHGEEHSDRHKRRYYATIEEIKNNPVPFDSVQKEDIVKRNDNPKLSGMNHRYKAIGHDPYLGLIFGTANIMTRTITLNEGRFKVSTYHVHSGENTTASGKTYKIDKLSAKANTGLMFEKIYERLETEKAEGFKALAYAVFKECIHLRSDIRTKKALPIPLLSNLSPNFSRIIGYLELDYLTIKLIEKEYVISVVIDVVISILHDFCYDDVNDISPELYRARRLKILRCSNEIATTNSFLQTWIRMACGDITAAKYFDFGGAINTLYREFTTSQKIAEILHEYLLSKETEYFKSKKENV